jgi:hypothetical protein
MWQEFPSTPLEPFKVSTEGTFYAVQLAAARKAGRIGTVPFLSGVPVNTFWDIGHSDGTAVWLHQQLGLQHRFIGFVEEWEEPYSHFVTELQRISTEHGGIVWGTHYLPHDAEHKRQLADRVSSPIEELQSLKLGGKWDVVPRVDDVMHGIQSVRKHFSEAWFDEAACKAGITHLSLYRKKWHKQADRWTDAPFHDIHSEGSDAFRQWAQMIDGGGVSMGTNTEALNRFKKRDRKRP